MAFHLIKYTSKSISAGIGVASEAIAEFKHRDDKTLAPAQTDKSVDHDDDADSDSEVERDEVEWALDDAAAELEAKASSPLDKKAFLETESQMSLPQDLKPLPQPVTLPQRRPGALSRGFVHGYAPILDECVGIDQDTFMRFLTDFDKASKASPVFDVVNLAAMGIGLIPSPVDGLTKALSIAISFASNTGKELQSRVRRNTYLDNVNEQFFQPRGLYCMIMSFKPDDPYKPIIQVDLNADNGAPPPAIQTNVTKVATTSSSTSTQDPTPDTTTTTTLVQTMSGPSNPIRRRLRKLRDASGSVSGEFALPDSAPLVYPAIDRAQEAKLSQQQELGSLPDISKPSIQDRIQSYTGFLDDYLDRRARARWQALHPGSKLTSLSEEAQALKLQASTSDSVGAEADDKETADLPSHHSPQSPTSPTEKEFVNRFADPNHPVHSGTIIGLVTGGKIDPVADMRAKSAIWRAKRRGVELSEEEIWNARMGRRTGGFHGPIGRYLQAGILYLIIANVPSEEEVRRVMAMGEGEGEGKAGGEKRKE